MNNTQLFLKNLLVSMTTALALFGASHFAAAQNSGDSVPRPVQLPEPDSAPTPAPEASAVTEAGAFGHNDAACCRTTTQTGLGRQSLKCGQNCAAQTAAQLSGTATGKPPAGNDAGTEK